MEQVWMKMVLMITTEMHLKLVSIELGYLSIKGFSLSRRYISKFN